MTLSLRLATLGIAAGALVSSLAIAASPASIPAVPEPLRGWTPWVLHGREDETCPPLASDGAVRVCAWPTTLDLELGERGGTFTQTWDFAREAWALLPGDAARWPTDVIVDGAAAAVTGTGDTPRVRLGPGVHRIQGKFSWGGLPEALPVPAATGVITLSIGGAAVELPSFDPQGRLWLQRRVGDAAAEDRLEVDTARLVRDTIPLQVLTKMRLRVAGQVREVLFPGAVPPGVTPTSLESQLPVRLEPDGGLRVQVRPGDWAVSFGVRHPGQISALKAAALPAPWPRQETWAFEAQSDLQVRELGGNATPVDPQQTTLPEEWRRNPSFLVLPGQELSFRATRRGDPQPAPDRLGLTRTVWLAMDGTGLTFRDEISGVKNTGWRLEIASPLEAGRIAVGGIEQLITRRAGSNRAGVELRQGNVQLVAESTLPRRAGGRIPAVGWEQDFSEVRGTLNLPPGWRLLALTGADRTGNTWISRWTLLDLFLVLIFGLAIWRLWGRWTGLAALVTLALSWHEPGAPTWVWVPFLIAAALERVVPSAQARHVARLAGRVFLLAVVAVATPFVITQARHGLYPQLTQHGGGGSLPPLVSSKMAVTPAVRTSPAKQVADGLGELKTETLNRAPKTYGSSYGEPQQLPLNLPNAAIQTGKGLPEWQWERVDFSWNGPVRRDETLALLLIGPRMNLALAFARILLTVVLLLAVGGFFPLRLRPARAGAGAAAAVIATLLIGPGAAGAADIPDKELLEELAKRLLAPPACVPNCADIPRLKVEATPKRLSLTLEVHAAAEVAVPLPSNPEQWMPDRITAGGAPARGVLRREGRLWLLAQRGITRVTMSGPLPGLETVLLPLPLRPHHVETALTGWSIGGIRADGRADEQLQLSRTGRAAGNAGELRAAALPPFVEVERTLRLGINWMVETVVRRVGPPGAAVVIAVPLLPGESVTLEGVQTDAGRVLVNMGPAAETYAWTSLLLQSPAITLTAGATDRWFEVWRLDASPIWHVETSGIPVVHHQRENRWLPEWRPWPGESVVLAVSRPEGVPGQTVTIDRSQLALAPGNRATEARLDFTLRGSQGGQQTVTLPRGAELLDVTIDGKTQPLRLEAGHLSLPVVPGAQAVALRWRSPGGMGAIYRPEMPGLGAGSVNASINLTVPGNRWVYQTAGPRLGPAVLWWGVMAIVVLAALLLARVPGLPLNTFEWVLLGIGLSQAHVAGALLVVGWLLALRGRRSLPASTGDGAFNLAQLSLVGLTVAALATIVGAVSNGLLGYPDLQIEGNGSHAALLRWYSDHSDATLPTIRVLTAPLWLYRVLMLGWSLWLAFALLRWLRFGWEAFSSGGLWRKIERSPRKPKPEPTPRQSSAPPEGQPEVLRE